MSKSKPIMGHIELPTFVEVHPSGLVTATQLGLYALRIGMGMPEFKGRALALVDGGGDACQRGATLNALIIEIIFSMGLGALSRGMEGQDV